MIDAYEISLGYEVKKLEKMVRLVKCCLYT